MFQEFEPYTISRDEYNKGADAINAAMRKLADENIAQQFELNVLNNFVDKYLPIRTQH